MRSHRASTAVVVALTSLVWLAPGLYAQPAKDSPAAQPAQDPHAQMKADLEGYMKLAQPGEHHKWIGEMAGRWKTVGRSWMSPGQPALEMTGTVESSWILGGRYLQSVHKGSFMGQAFEGRGLDGYDNTTHEYFGTWVDNMGTGVLLFRGRCDDPCHALTENAEGVDPMSGKPMKTRTVTTFLDSNSYRFEMYMVGAGKDGADEKVMELVATRER